MAAHLTHRRRGGQILTGGVRNLLVVGTAGEGVHRVLVVVVHHIRGTQGVVVVRGRADVCRVLIHRRRRVRIEH